MEPSSPLMAGSARPSEPNYAGTVVVHTHGCKLNQADSSELVRQFRQSGYRVVQDVREADIFVLNSCTVTAEADAKARQSLRAARRANPNAVVVAAGCYPQRAEQELAEMGEVTLVVGNEEKPRLPSLAIAAHRKQAGLGEPEDFSPGSLLKATGNLLGRTRAMVKIQEGCDQVCAYCIVPKVRGRERSIPPQEIIGQISRRTEEGCREVVLTGTQLGTYGFDLPGVNLKRLIAMILERSDVDRLRVSSLQPQEIDRELLALWLQDARLCPHFHIPLQSGSNAVLKAMRRRYDTDQFERTVNVVRHALPDAGVTADLIVGFPGESADNFDEGLAFAERMAFSDVHIFPYSVRPGTTAAHLGNQVEPVLKRERMVRALDMRRRSFEAFRKGLLGAVLPILWEGSLRMGDGLRIQGLTDNYVRVTTPLHHASEQQPSLANSITPARLLELVGDVVTAEIPEVGRPAAQGDAGE